MYKVLVVDDEEILRELIMVTLEIGEYHVLAADNGIDALALAEREKPDLIILDVMMPGMSGYEVCREIKGNPDLTQIKVLILTAMGQQAARQAGKEALADYYLAKPFSPMELLAMVGTILAQ